MDPASATIIQQVAEDQTLPAGYRLAIILLITAVSLLGGFTMILLKRLFNSHDAEREKLWADMSEIVIMVRGAIKELMGRKVDD